MSVSEPGTVPSRSQVLGGYLLSACRLLVFLSLWVCAGTAPGLCGFPPSHLQIIDQFIQPEFLVHPMVQAGGRERGLLKGR